MRRAGRTPRCPGHSGAGRSRTTRRDGKAMTLTARPAAGRAFSDVSALIERQPGSFEAVVDPEWTIGGKPNGGYLLAMLGAAAASVSAHSHVIAASAHYLH